MRAAIAVISAGAIAAAGGVPPARAMEADKLFEKLSPSVFVVYASDIRSNYFRIGSGVVVAPGKVVTNCHVLAKMTLVFVKRGNIMYGATLEFADPQRDLCQLDVKELKAPAVVIRDSSTLRVGERVYALGAPDGLELTLTDGLLSSLRAGDDKDAPVLQTSAPISPGSSGGGLFDSDGKLIGITSRVKASSQNIQGIGFAAPADWVRDLPKRGAENLAKLKEPPPARPAAAAGAAVAALDPSLPKEMPQVGDTWTYAAIDQRYKPRDRSKKFVHTVQTVDKASIAERVTLNGNSIGDFTSSRSPTAVVRVGILELMPFATGLQGLKVGDAWGSVPVRIVDGSGNSAGVGDPWIIERARAVANERIVVPAGTFDAVKVVLEGRVQIGALGTSSVTALSGYKAFTGTVWYAPSVKRIAKAVIEGATFTDAYELESYSIR
jgi:serine protease Do